jgi:hypothetical protein
MRKPLLTLSLAALACFATASRADSLFDNYSEGSTPPYSLGSGFAVIKPLASGLGYDTETAASFAPSTDAFLTSITLAFAASSTAVPDSLGNVPVDSNHFDITLRADDNSGLPGSVIESWTDVVVNTAFPTADDVTLTSVINPHLLHADKYWIAITAADLNSFGSWYISTNPAGGAGAEVLQLKSDGTPYPGAQPNFVTDTAALPAFKVEGSADLTTTSVPTPAAALAGIPLLSLLAANSLRKRLRRA